MYIRTAGRVSEPLVSALVGDERCFVIENMGETYEKLQLQISAEQQQWGAIGPGMPVKELIPHYKVYLLDLKVNCRKCSQRMDGIKFVRQYQPPSDLRFLLYIPPLFELADIRALWS
jgi:hypothetical protein